MKRYVWSLLGALSLFATSAWAGDKDIQASMRNSQLDTKLEKQVAPLMQQFEAAWNRHDPKAMSAIFDVDGVLINPLGKVARGRAEVEKLFQRDHAGMMKDTTFTARLVDVREIRPGVAILDQHTTISGIRDPAGNTLPSQDNHVTLVLTRDGRQWRVEEARAFAFQQPPPQGVGGAGMTPDSSGEPMPTPVPVPEDQPEDQPEDEDMQVPPTY